MHKCMKRRIRIRWKISRKCVERSRSARRRRRQIQRARNKTPYENEKNVYGTQAMYSFILYIYMWTRRRVLYNKRMEKGKKEKNSRVHSRTHNLSTCTRRGIECGNTTQHHIIIHILFAIAGDGYLRGDSTVLLYFLLLRVCVALVMVLG